MKKNENPSTPSAPPTLTEGASELNPKPPAQGERPTANDIGKRIDRPGFDIGGSSGDTHAGTGLGLGTDAFDTPGNRRLPGRRLDNDLTIPRWSGPEPHDPTASHEKTTGDEAPFTSKTKKTR